MNVTPKKLPPSKAKVKCTLCSLVFCNKLYFLKNHWGKTHQRSPVGLHHVTVTFNLASFQISLNCQLRSLSIFTICQLQYKLILNCQLFIAQIYLTYQLSNPKHLKPANFSDFLNLPTKNRKPANFQTLKT